MHNFWFSKAHTGYDRNELAFPCLLKETHALLTHQLHDHHPTSSCSYPMLSSIKKAQWRKKIWQDWRTRKQRSNSKWHQCALTCLLWTPVCLRIHRIPPCFSLRSKSFGYCKIYLCFHFIGKNFRTNIEITLIGWSVATGCFSLFMAFGFLSFVGRMVFAPSSDYIPNNL